MTQVYRLDPIADHLNDPKWQRSNWNKPVLVGADSERHARDAAALATRVQTAKYEKITHESPWLEPALTSCSLDASGAKVAAGAVASLNGIDL